MLSQDQAMQLKTPVLLLTVFLCHVGAKKDKKPFPYNQTNPSEKFDNPNEVRDRIKYSNKIKKPQLPQDWDHRNKQPFNPAWMDYCDPYHCNDYHKPACGLNRNNMKFKWFQSGCHIIINNECAYWRGNLKYDIVDTRFCVHYVMNLRMGCPQTCEDEVEPTCGISSLRNHAVLFRNRCSLDMFNCRRDEDEYEEVRMEVCDYYFS